MPERLIRGTPASPGLAVGEAWRPAQEIETAGGVPPERREHERDTAVAALAEAAAALTSMASGLKADEAEIIEAGALMASDPMLVRAVEDAILADGRAAPDAITRATNEFAGAIAAVGDETLAARADDVRSLGRRAARLAAGSSVQRPPGLSSILVAADAGPADVAEAGASLRGVALAGGGPTAHAAIVARALGIPMVTTLGDQALRIADGARLVLDGSAGTLLLEPSAQSARRASADMRTRRLAAQRAHEQRERPAVTRDGRRVTVLANVGSRQEADVALRAGAEGIGLLRTELAFLDAAQWPSEQEHTEALEPILATVAGRRAVVRVLDFGADKSPPFLARCSERGLELLLAHRDALRCQARAILRAAQRRDLQVLLPMVDTPEQVAQSRAVIEDAARSLRIDRIPPLGSMIETPAAVRNASAIAGRCDFLSVGTNDLTATALGMRRFAANNGRAHDPKVLRLIARAVEAAHEAGIPIEVCGEAASDPITLPLLIGLGVDEVSVGAALVGAVREWIRQLDTAQAAGLARSALTMESAAEVESAGYPLSGGDQAGRPGATVAAL